MNVPYLGQICALSSAVLWALAIVLFKKSGEHVHPIALNAFKVVLALVLYVPTIYATGGTLFEPFTAREYALFAASGAVGMAVGDTLLFQSLNMIGASASALVSTLYSPFMIALSFVWLGETLTAVQFLGVALILAAVLETAPTREHAKVGARRRVAGVLIGAGGLLAMAVGVVMIKHLLDRAPLLWAIEVRQVGGVVALGVYLLLHRDRARIVRSLWTRGSRTYTLTSSLIGGYAALMLWLGGMKFTKVSVAAALNQTNMIFVLLFAVWILHERISPLRVAAIFVAFAGALLVTFG
jgi:drug/metabolite transporter (DMT)-like permease